MKTLALALTALALTACTGTDPEAVALDAAPAFDVVAYDDGAGVIYVGDTEVATLEGGALPFDCTTDGNLRCGPGVAATPGCTTVVVAASPARRLVADYALDYCTGRGVVAVRVATDTDVEGEVV